MKKIIFHLHFTKILADETQHDSIGTKISRSTEVRINSAFPMRSRADFSSFQHEREERKENRKIFRGFSFVCETIAPLGDGLASVARSIQVPGFGFRDFPSGKVRLSTWRMQK